MHLGDLCAMDIRCTNPRILVGNNKYKLPNYFKISEPSNDGRAQRTKFRDFSAVCEGSGWICM